MHWGGGRLRGYSIGKQSGLVLVTQPPLEHGSARSNEYFCSVATWHEFADFCSIIYHAVDANSFDAKRSINVIGVFVGGTAPIAKFDLPVFVYHRPNGHCFHCTVGCGDITDLCDSCFAGQ